MRAVGSLRRTPKGWRIHAEAHVILRAKRIFAGSSKQHGNELFVADSINNARDLTWFRERFEIEIPEAADAAYLEKRTAEHHERQSVVDRMLAGALAPRRFEMALPPREYQATAAEMAIRLGGLLIADDLGLGKTIIAIAMFTDPSTRPALVVTKAPLMIQWQRQLRKFAPALTSHIIKGTKPYDIGAAGHSNPEQLALPGSMPDVIITAYSRVSGWAETLSAVVRSVVFDEIQELRKGDSSQKGSASKAIARGCAVRTGLTATPVYNEGAEIFPIIDILNPGALGTYEEFATEHGAPYLKDPKAFGFFLRDSGLMLRRTRAEVGRELPPLEKVLHEVDYDDQPLDDVATAAEKLAQTILASTSAPTARFKASGEFDLLVRKATGVAKAPYVAEFVRILLENGARVVLYGWHRDVYAIWNERLKDMAPVMYTGSESPKQKDEAVRAFTGIQADGSEGEPTTRLFIASLRSGEGLDSLQHACTCVVFGELDWSPGVHEQCIGRVHRDGQTKPVVAYYLWTNEGSDPILMDILGVKREQVEGIRNPTADVLEKLEVNPERIRDLARQYLARPRKKGVAA
jgi:SNF2 family DNA or RNA helicase